MEKVWLLICKILYKKIVKKTPEWVIHDFCTVVYV